MNKSKINKKKDIMLYLIHIDWSWIKQRPQFLSYELKEYFNLTLFFPKNYRNNNIINSKTPSFVNSFYKLPFQRFKNSLIFDFLNKHFILLQLSNKLKRSKYIWLTSPEIYYLIKKKISINHKLIYDCMDDFVEFPNIKNNVKQKKKMYTNERDLISRADNIFSSSLHLKNILIERYKIIPKKINVINNAISSEYKNIEYTIAPNDYTNKVHHKDLLYIGTISSWFDFNLIIDSLNQFKYIRYILIGPCEIDIPPHERIIHLGIKEHNTLNNYMQLSDALIMPFKVNDLVKSVNPVKLYEYIHSGKPIITCSYDEIDKFNDFVYRYNNQFEFNEYLELLMKDKLSQKSKKDCNDFLYNNKWVNRTKNIIEVLHKK